MDKTQWLQRFVTKRHQIQPAVDRRAAADLADMEWDHAADCPPEEAAEINALEEPPGEVGAPS